MCYIRRSFFEKSEVHSRSHIFHLQALDRACVLGHAPFALSFFLDTVAAQGLVWRGFSIEKSLVVFAFFSDALSGRKDFSG